MATVLAGIARVDVTAALQVLSFVAAATLLAVETPTAVNGYDVPLVLAFPLCLVHVGALPLTVRRPMIGTIVATAAALALQLAGTPTGVWPWWPVMIVTQGLVLLIVGYRASWQAGLGAWLIMVVPTTVATVATGHTNTEAVAANLVVFMSIAGAALTLGLIAAHWRAMTEQLLTERRASADELSRRILAEDRARIARELHDVVAHSMSIINVQASTARYRNPSLDSQAIGEFEEIASSSRQALAEMRGLLGVLRADDVGGELSPQPGIGDIPELVGQSQRAGMRVTLEELPAEQAAEVSEVVGLTAYRVVQEALTNAFRHAPGSVVTVACTRERGSIILSVRNSPPSAIRTARASAGSGLGLVGMRERVASVGGTVESGPSPEGGFIIRAVLPVRGEMTGGVG